jgi:CheY-like chemotaxis protein
MLEQPSILLIEDEPRLRHNLEVLLVGEGYRVASAEDGAEGIQKLQEEPFDLVITDVVMPEVDGFQVMEYLRDWLMRNQCALRGYRHTSVGSARV